MADDARVGSGRLGASMLESGRCAFTVWAPKPEQVELCLLDARVQPERVVSMTRDERGYAHAVVDGVAPGTHYGYRLDGEKVLPDPVSRLQADGVHGASVVVDEHFPWTDATWTGLPLRDHVIYELHVGTFTEAGTFDGVVGQLERLVELGVTALEIMPVAAFPGARNWGYDGVLPYAVQRTYGGPDGLRRLVDACHARGIAVVLDVVYNHLGPEGNYLSLYGPYFTDAYRTPWGTALNFDDAGSEEVRRFFVDNAVEWIEQFHIDGLRLDAVHAIYDRSAYPILEEIGDAVHAAAERSGRRAWVIAESDLNDARMVRSTPMGGLGLDGMWSDDFHHALHGVLTGERAGYYADYGSVEQLARAWERGCVFEGQRSEFRGRRHGRPTDGIAPEQLVVCAQNHDQVGNRMLGERLSALLDFEGLKLAAGVVLLSPFTPLLFMGEEYGEQAPFLYFTSHGDPDLIEAVRRGRREEFSAFRWQGEAPDPQAEDTFRRSRLNPERRNQGQSAVLAELYRVLIAQRAWLPRAPRRAVGWVGGELMWIEQGEGEAMQTFVFAFADAPTGGQAVPWTLPLASGCWQKRLDSAEPRWGGPGSGWPERIESGAGLQWLGGRGFVVYERHRP